MPVTPITDSKPRVPVNPNSALAAGGSSSCTRPAVPHVGEVSDLIHTQHVADVSASLPSTSTAVSSFDSQQIGSLSGLITPAPPTHTCPSILRQPHQCTSSLLSLATPLTHRHTHISAMTSSLSLPAHTSMPTLSNASLRTRARKRATAIAVASNTYGDANVAHPDVQSISSSQAGAIPITRKRARTSAITSLASSPAHTSLEGLSDISLRTDTSSSRSTNDEPVTPVVPSRRRGRRTISNSSLASSSTTPTNAYVDLGSCDQRVPPPRTEDSLTASSTNSPPVETNTRVSMNMYYSYQIHDRLGVYTIALHGAKLFQQYLVDAYIAIERNRLDYFAQNQNDLRTDILRGVEDAIGRGDTHGRNIGKRIILPSSFTGGPRYMYKHYQDALAICRVHGNPQYFITFTCNANWPEIQRELNKTPLLSAQDRADLIARVFEMKVDSFILFLKEERPFGVVAADLYTIEFQKRGLPHCHTLLWVTEQFRVRDAEQIDSFICAEFPDKDSDPLLHRIVADTMVHGPCGLLNNGASCMHGGTCYKNFPKPYESVTRIDDKGRAFYRRRQNSQKVQKGRAIVDCGYVVPYNKDLSLRFRAHINVEHCGWSMMIKYLFKYISKGPDRVKYSVGSGGNGNEIGSSSATDDTIDEIKNFVDGRFICPHEAAWRILNFPIHHRDPAVQALCVHLPNQQNLTFREQSSLQEIVDNPAGRRTTLTEWLHCNNTDPAGRHLRYVDYLKRYRWDLRHKTWIRRTSRKKASIGRLVYVHPTSGELFYLRMLLNHKTGCRSFNDIKTVSGLIHPTYRAACEAMGLIGDDTEWALTFEEAALWATARELRFLFVQMLLFCEISNPLVLWTQHWDSMSDDIIQRITKETNVDPKSIPAGDVQQQILYELEKLLNTSSCYSTLSNYGLPMPEGDLLKLINNRLLMEERCYDRESLGLEHERCRASMHPKQLQIYDLVMQSYHSKKQVLLFIYGHGGTGKTFLWNTIISAIRSAGDIVLAVAGSGIASLLLPSGRTAHSRFQIPIDITDESVCNMTKGSPLAGLLREASLIIWDEAPMTDRRCFECLDRTLQDILDKKGVPFGGKSVLLGGDFRQTLPIKKRAGKAKVIASSLPKSYLWPHFRLIKLTQNMRLLRHGVPAEERESIGRFSQWLVDVGDGRLGTRMATSSLEYRDVVIPREHLIDSGDDPLLQLIRFIYDDATLAAPTAINLSDKAIVCPKNITANEINKKVLHISPGAISTYLSTDSITPRANDGGNSEILYPEEYLNTLSFSGLPSHCLELKVNTPVILLRNINQTCGMCNGTRLIVTQLLPRVIEATIITGNSIGNRVYIPRITFLYDDKELPFIFRRRQYPLRLCYAMTINKSQGQSLSKIGVYLPQPVFGHGQLYVAFSRATSPSSLKVLIVPQQGLPNNTTRNIVYSDFLEEIEDNQVRVLHKWKPYKDGDIYSYLLVDKSGNGIQATFDLDEEEDMDRLIAVSKCYVLDKYTCKYALTVLKVTPHPASIKVGKNISIADVEDDGSIPNYYFNFYPFDQLYLRKDYHKILTGSFFFSNPLQRHLLLHLSMANEMPPATEPVPVQMGVPMTIADVTLNSTPRPLEVRVLNMWKTFCADPTMTCLLVDKYHDTIQAIFKQTEYSEVGKKLKVGTAYLLSKYTITLPPKFDKASPHPCALRIQGNVIAYSLGSREDIPLRCFNLVPRYHLNSKPYTDRQLIDYMGRVTDLEVAEIDDNTTVLRMQLEAPGCLPVTVSLWDLIYKGLDIRRFTKIDREVIVVATALRVVTRGGAIRLQCTGGTQVFIDPGSVARNDMARYFRLARGEHRLRRLAVRHVSETYPVPGLPVTQLSTLYTETEDTLLDQTYLIACSVIKLPLTQEWYKITCVACDAIVNTQRQPHGCPTHGDRYLLYRYTVRCTMDDDSAKINVLLSDASLITMTGVRCFNLITIDGFTNVNILPTPIANLIHTKWLLTVNQGRRLTDSMLEFRGTGVSPIPIAVVKPGEPGHLLRWLSSSSIIDKVGDNE
ncbi:hypothetical protein SSX86_012659 [Deinandra increscens subsp. villosa]|uniref:ATP-dependent DNA helicase n=1 Tax=Deinandra increscens subsp. villosa TaxID=3103831 RepID=A0AAP0DC73_9ASTR